MARRVNRKRIYLNEIGTVGELREARRELSLREEYAGARLADEAADTFSLGGLLSIVAPPGSAGERIVGGIGTGVALMQGLSGVFRVFGGGGQSRSRSHSHSRAHGKAVHHAGTYGKAHAVEHGRSRVVTHEKKSCGR